MNDNKIINLGDPTAAKDAANSKGVGDGLIESVASRNFKVNEGARFIPSHLDGVHTVFGRTEDMDVVNAIVMGDTIKSVTIEE